MSKFLESTLSSSKFFILVLSPWTLISGNVCFEFFSVPSVISMSSGAVFLSVSLSHYVSDSPVGWITFGYIHLYF